MQFVDEAGCERLTGKVRSADEQVTIRGCLQLLDGRWLKGPLDSGPFAGNVSQRGRKDDLLGRPPDRCEVRGHGVFVRDVEGFPGDHHLVEPTSVQLRPDRAHEVVDHRMDVVVGDTPVEVAVAVRDVAVERCDHRIDQLRHSSPPLPRSNPVAV